MDARHSTPSTGAAALAVSPTAGEVDDEQQDGCLEQLVDREFTVHDGPSAAWVVRKVVESRTHAERVRQWAASELRRAERDEAWFLQRFGGQLETWLRTELERQGGRRRSVALPSGTIGLRQQAPRLEVTNETLIVEWCRKRLPDAVRVSVEANGTAGMALATWCGERGDETRQRVQILREPLNRHFTETGELPDGSVARPAQDQFYIK